MPTPRWEVVGGEATSGIVVREGLENTTPQLERLGTGAHVLEIELIGDRLHFRKMTGAGPAEGWVSIALSTGKVLVVRVEAEPESEDDPDAPEPSWVQQSRGRLQAQREGRQCLPGPEGFQNLGGPGDGKLLRFQDEAFLQKLWSFRGSWKKLSKTKMEEMTPQNLPGYLTEMAFPHSSKQIKEFGPEWLTKAFHKYGTLPLDNRVTKIVRMYELDTSGFEAAGGSGHKNRFTVEYEKPDPELHVHLFAKMPWDYFEHAVAKKMRINISTFGDSDGSELFAQVAYEGLFPFRIPKVYYADICRETTNFIAITEQVPFGKQVIDESTGKVTEQWKERPWKVMPVCQKYQDFLLMDAPSIYFQLIRAMARLAGWDHSGAFDMWLGPLPRYSPEDFYHSQGIAGRPPISAQAVSASRRLASAFLDDGIDFAANVAPRLFSDLARSPEHLSRMKEDTLKIAPFWEDMQTYAQNSSDFQGMIHVNLQADNAWFWKDEHGDLDSGLFDLMGMGRGSLISCWMGCLGGAESDLLCEHIEGLCKCFADEFHRYGGPKVDWQEVYMRYNLVFCKSVMEGSQWVKKDILAEAPRELWKDVDSKFHPICMSRWNVRCRSMALVASYDYFLRMDILDKVEQWKAGPGKLYVRHVEGEA